MDDDKNRLTITEVTPAYWRVTLDNPPLNLFDPRMHAEFWLLLDRIEADTQLKVVVFDSANPDYFIAHLDLVDWSVPDVPGAAPMSEWVHAVTRLSQSRVVSIASVRGRAHAHGNEFLLACDMRFASREKAIFGHIEVALGTVPGGGGAEWLSALTGRSRALEIILGSADFDADTADRYGWINRAVPDADLDAFVDGFARRIAGYDRDVLAIAKARVNAVAALPGEPPGRIPGTRSPWP